MKFSEKWLREWVNPQVTTDDLAEQLTMAGLEVDSIEPAAKTFSGVVVGEVTQVVPHPDADRLRVCQVHVGENSPLNIVCGAANVVEGMKVPCATIGAKLPGDFKIKRSKLRGVESQGMLCSAVELGMAEESDGLMPLAVDAPVGVDVREYLDLDDTLIEVDLTPNRGDCLSLAGIAREVGVINGTNVTVPEIIEIPAVIDDQFPVRLDASADCPRYVGRVIRNIDPSAQTPLWMQERLRRSGMRSLGPSVDVTNYILLELGQPMHAFDLSKLDGEIVVRRAAPGETVTLLNDEVAELTEETLVIADQSRVLAMAGIMGGAETGVTESTQDIFLESAFFSPTAIIGRARHYGLQTDSSYRFERGVDSQLQRKAMERATQLLLEIVGGEPGPVIERVDESQLPKIESIKLRRDRVTRVLGVSIEDDQISEIITRLGMTMSPCEGGWQVEAPSYRFDIAIEEDLIEELGRIYGYSNLPTTRIQAEQVINPRSEEQLGLPMLQTALVERGYQEAITYSFVDPEVQKKIDPQAQAIPLANPISSEMADMRTSLWTGLVQAVQYNLNRQQGRVRLFETGLRFRRVGGETEQTPMLAFVACGSAVEEQWGTQHRGVDFFDIKSDLEALSSLTHRSQAFKFVAAEHPALHPGQTAAIELDERQIGWVGALHPSVAKDLGLKQPLFLVELELNTVLLRQVPAFEPLSKFPAVRRDLAIVVDDGIGCGAVIDSIRSVSTDMLRNLKVFDVYMGQGVEKGKKSLAIGLTLQHPSRTLTDTEVDEILEKVVKKLEINFDAKLRD